MGMPSRRTNNFPENGRGLGHVSDVTPTIFGSTVGYPSDSLASCFLVVAYIKTAAHILSITTTAKDVPYGLRKLKFNIQLIYS